MADSVQSEATVGSDTGATLHEGSQAAEPAQGAGRSGDALEGMMDDFDVSLAAEHIEKMNSRRRLLFFGLIGVMVLLIILALVFKKATFSPWFTPLAIPIYIIICFMMAVTFGDFYFDNERIKDTDPRLRHRLVDRYIKRLYLPAAVLLILVILLVTPFLLNVINDNTTEEDSLSISEKGPGRFSFHGRDPFDLTVFHYIQIKAEPSNLKINCTIQYEEVANQIAENRSIPNAEAREPYYDATRLNTNKNLNTPTDPKDGRLNNNSFYEIRFPPEFWEFRTYAITIYNPNKARVDVYFKFGKELDMVFVNVLRIAAILALTGHILWYIYLRKKKTEFEDLYDDYIATLEQRKKEAQEKQAQLEAMRQAAVPPVVMVGGVPVVAATAVQGMQGIPAVQVQQPQYVQQLPLQPAPAVVQPQASVALPQTTISPAVQPMPTATQVPLSVTPATPLSPQTSNTKIRCPQCKNSFEVPKEPRPLNIKCPTCGKTGVIGKKAETPAGSAGSVSPQPVQPAQDAQGGTAPPTTAVSTPSSKIRCPGCKNTFEVAKVRPLNVECPFCHKKGTLK